jgi:hypothetical protein
MSLGYSHRGFAERALRHQQKEAFRASDSVCFKAIGGVLLGGTCAALFMAVAGMEAQSL